METVKIETESPKVTTANVSQEVQDTIAKNLKAIVDAKKKQAENKKKQAEVKKKSSKPTYTKKGGKRSKDLKVATTSLADVFKALKQN